MNPLFKSRLLIKSDSNPRGIRTLVVGHLLTTSMQVAGHQRIAKPPHQVARSPLQHPAQAMEISRHLEALGAVLTTHPPTTPRREGIQRRQPRLLPRHQRPLTMTMGRGTSRARQAKVQFDAGMATGVAWLSERTFVNLAIAIESVGWARQSIITMYRQRYHAPWARALPFLTACYALPMCSMAAFSMQPLQTMMRNRAPPVNSSYPD